MSTSLFGVGASINVNVNGTLIPQSFTGLAGQTLFNLSAFTYSPGTNSLLVFINGQKQIVVRDFIETSSSSFTLNEGVVIGDFVDVIGFPTTSNQTGPAAGVSFTQIGSNAITQSIQSKLQQYTAVSDYTSLVAAIATAVTLNVPLYVPPGTYNITANLDCGSVQLIFAEGALFNITAGITVIVRKSIQAGNYQIFSSTGVVISAGARNPMWWGAVISSTSPGTVVAAANTLAFRKCAMSFYSEYVLNAGTLAVPGVCIPFYVEIPVGAFYLSNGFSAAVGVPVRGIGGTGAATLLCRLAANEDTDTAIPLLTVGQNLQAAPGLAYQNDPGTSQSTSTFAAAGFGQTSAAAQDLYFVDQHPTAGAFCPKYPGCQFHDVFFTSCGIGILFSGTADITGNNIIVDMGLTGLSFVGVCQNIKLTNTILYDQISQSVAINSSVYDCSLELHIEYPQGIALNIPGSNIQNLKFPNLTIIQNASTGTNIVQITGTNVDIDISDYQFRNFGACSAIVLGGDTTTSLKLRNGTFDGIKTGPAYNQNSNMQAISMSAGRLLIDTCVMRNLGVRSIVAGTVNIIVRGLTYYNMGTPASVFDLSGCTGGSVQFYGVQGDDTTPLLVSATGAADVRVKNSSKWLGSAFVDGSFFSWNVPLPNAGQLLATILAQPDGTASVRKSSTILYEKSVEALPTLTDTITSASLFASPAANGHGPVTSTLVFSGNATTQAATGVPTAGKLRVPNTYSNVSANVDYLN